MNAYDRRSRGFTLLEVLLSVALFAIAVVVLAGAYINVLEGVESVRTDRAFEQEVRWVREQILTEPDIAKVEEGGESVSPDFGTAVWEVRVEPTDLADLFRVEMRVEMGAVDGKALREVTTHFLVLRPQWSETVEREKLRTEARSRIEGERRRQGVLPPKGT